MKRSNIAKPQSWKEEDEGREDEWRQRARNILGTGYDGLEIYLIFWYSVACISWLYPNCSHGHQSPLHNPTTAAHHNSPDNDQSETVLPATLWSASPWPGICSCATCHTYFIPSISAETSLALRTHIHCPCLISVEFLLLIDEFKWSQKQPKVYFYALDNKPTKAALWMSSILSILQCSACNLNWKVYTVWSIAVILLYRYVQYSISCYLDMLTEFMSDV